MNFYDSHDVKIHQHRGMERDYEGMHQREKLIPLQGIIRISEALDRLIEYYTATNKPDEAKKWRAERANYPQAKKPIAPEKK